MSEDFNPFAPGTGLKSNFDAVIRDGTFTVNTQSGNHEIILMLDCDDGDEYPVRCGLGPGWESYDGGLTVAHPGGAQQLFSSNSYYSDFMVHAMEAGAKDEMLKRNKELDNKGPRVAMMWAGLRFHFDALERPTRIPVDKEDGTREWQNTTRARVLPVKFLGVVGQSQLPGTAATVSSANHSDPLTVLDAVTAAKVVKAGKEADTYNKFIDAMLDLTDGDGTPIMERTEIGVAVADESWYVSLHG